MNVAVGLAVGLFGGLIAGLLGVSPGGILVPTCLAQGQPQKSPTDSMRELRLMMLTTPPSQLGIKPTGESPRVAGVLMDWPLGEHTATIVAMSDGNASLYTTSTFGVVGGVEHESVRVAAKRFAKAAERFHNEAAPTTDYSYPERERVRFYFVTFQGVRVIDTDMASMRARSGRYVDLFALGQAVVTELRIVTEKKR
jgi:hypothetical protein